MNRSCRSGEDAGARVASVGEQWASVSFSMACPHAPQDGARPAGRVHILTAWRCDVRVVVSTLLRHTEELARTGGRTPPGHGRCSFGMRRGLPARSTFRPRRGATGRTRRPRRRTRRTRRPSGPELRPNASTTRRNAIWRYCVARARTRRAGIGSSAPAREGHVRNRTTHSMWRYTKTALSQPRWPAPAVVERTSRRFVIHEKSTAYRKFHTSWPRERRHREELSMTAGDHTRTNGSGCASKRCRTESL